MPDMRNTDDRSPALARVAKGQLCSGCGGCAAAAPGKVEAAPSADGYLRPVQHERLTDEEEARVAAICPGLGLTQDAPAPDPLWGPHRSMRTGHATDPALRRNASSGGVLSAILVHLLETGAVEFILQIAADPDNPTGNRTVLSRTREEVFAAAGSRYAPSAPLAGLEAHLAAGRRFAFVGKPCDVAALRALARGDGRIDACIPYMLSFFCAGVPSAKGAEEVVRALGADPATVTAFRYRGDGWPGRAVATLADGSTPSMTYHESWGGVLSRHVQFRCKICPDGVGGFADLACADAWESDERGYPVFEEAEGISLAVGRTARGEALLDAAEAAGAIALRPFDPQDLAAIQPGQFGRITALAARLAALRVTSQPTPRYRGFRLLAAARRARPRALAVNFLGTARRILQGRR